MNKLEKPPAFESLSFLSVEARTALEKEVRGIAREELSRPLYITQRNCEAVAGLPRREFLEGARTKAFPSDKIRRVVTARTDDVVRWVESRLGPHRAEPANGADAEAVAFARSGARRVAPRPADDAEAVAFARVGMRRIGPRITGSR